MIIGHRGASALAPENTLAAFARAFDEGVDGIELDVRLSRDGVPVVIHDATLRRTGLRSGEVGVMTSRELAAVDVGSWFNRAHPVLARAEYENQGIPTLGKALESVKDRPGVIYVEMKSEGADLGPVLVQSVVDTIARFGFEDRTVVISFDLAAVKESKSLNPSIRTGALFSPRRGRGLNWRVDKVLNATARCGADELLLHRLLARPDLVEKANIRKLPIIVWTVDDPLWVSRARALGIHSLITNNPAELSRVA